MSSTIEKKMSPNITKSSVSSGGSLSNTHIHITRLRKTSSRPLQFSGTSLKHTEILEQQNDHIWNNPDIQQSGEAMKSKFKMSTVGRMKKFITSKILDKQRKNQQVHVIDVVCRYVFPITFVIIDIIHFTIMFM